MRQRRSRDRVQVRLTTLGAAALCLLVGSCTTSHHPTRVLPMPPTAQPVATTYVQLGSRIEGTLRFVPCSSACPEPTPKIPITHAEMLAARGAGQVAREVLQLEAPAIAHTSTPIPAVVAGSPAPPDAALPRSSAEQVDLTTKAAVISTTAAPGRDGPLVVNVLFLDNSAVLGPQGRLQVLFAVHYAPDGSLLRVMGRTDARQDNPAARRLASERAAAVASSLRRAGVSEERINVSYLGAGDWANGRNATAADKAANRRAIIAVTTPARPVEAAKPDDGEGLRIALALAR